MPELPDVTIYVEHLARRLEGAKLIQAWVPSPNLLRTAAPPIENTFGLEVIGVRRMGKRIVIALERDLFMVLHLMVAGRLHWRAAGEEPRGRRKSAARSAAPDARDARPLAPRRFGKNVLAVFELSTGELSLTEAATHRRASLHVLRGEEAVAELDPGGLEPLAATLAQFRAALLAENHTLKRALTDPRLLSGMGNAYSDEILHCARLSPLQLTSRLVPEEIARLHDATREVLAEWTERLRDYYGETFPEKVTAFREGMAVHGRFREPCPRCGAPIQRIVYADNETNYCAICQTGGRLLADRALSRLLKDDWPKTLEAMEG